MTSLDPQVPFVPPGYLRRRCAGFDLWYERDELQQSLAFIERMMSSCIAWVDDELGYRPRRALHLCMYHSNQATVESLDRDVPANMAMVPFSSDDASLIVVQSPSAHPMNGDEERMRRVLVHELCHTLVRERTGSLQMLGDGMRDLRVRPWFDEGFAEALSRRAVGALPLETSLSAEKWGYEDLDRYLCDLGSENRAGAFTQVTQIVERLIDEKGPKVVFQNLIAISSVDEDLEDRGPTCC